MSLTKSGSELRVVGHSQPQQIDGDEGPQRLCGLTAHALKFLREKKRRKQTEFEGE